MSAPRLAVGFVPRFIRVAPGVRTIVAPADAGLGMSLLISPAPHTDEQAVVFRPLSDDLPPWEMAPARSRANRSPGTRPASPHDPDQSGYARAR